MPDPQLSCAPAAAALRRLQEGNARFLAGGGHADRSHTDMLAHLVRGQQPYATILCCSDSRVPPELVFDAGLGDLFVVRVAGNVASAEVYGSLQYAGAHLGTPLFLVLGHDGCGAVKASIETLARGTQQRSRIQTLVDAIVPGLGDLDLTQPPEALTAQAVEANVRWTMRQIAETPEASANLAAGRLGLVGAVYELESGRVRFLP